MPAARLLDLTRLISRAGRTLTGIDRVELAYLDAITSDSVPAFGLVRTALGYVLLDRAGMRDVGDACRHGRWGRPDLVSRLSRLDPARRAAQSLVRSRALDRTLPQGLGRMLMRHLPEGTAYLNTGHSNLTARVMGAVRGLHGASIVALIHDTIPLDHPDWQREGTVERFRAKLRRVSAGVDLVIVTSGTVAADVTRHLSAMGRCPPVITVPLGVPVAVPDPGGLPPDPAGRPYFVTVGTIEPRKNHALLLDAWSQLGPEPPTLYLCGTRGWRNEAVFARLDARPPGIVERPGLSDGAVAALVQGARALLFPSLAEGYGIPAFEALALGTPVVAAPLPVFRDLLGEWAVYRDPADPYLWAATIRDLAQAPRRPVTGFVPPQWDQHFKVVLKAT